MLCSDTVRNNVWVPMMQVSGKDSLNILEPDIELLGEECSRKRDQLV